MDGEFCRWDGLTGRRSGGAVEAALKRANRLRALEADIAKLAAAARAAQAAHAAAADAVRRAAANEAAARDEQKRAFEAARVSREKIATANKAGEETRRLLAVTESEVAAVRCERTDATSAFAAASEALAAIPQDDEARAASASAKRRLTEAREAESRAKIALERTIQEANHRRQRFEAIMREAAQWTQRREQAAAQKKEIGTRIDEVETARKEALERPAASGDALGIAQEAVDVAKKGTDGASAELAKAEAQRDSSEAALRSTESALAVLREARARLLAAIETAQVVDRSVDESISEKLGPKVRGEAPSDGDGGAPSAPRDEALERALDGRRRGVSIAELSVIAKVDPALPLDLAAAESKHARLERERESLGAVNFLAEAELAEQEKRYGDIERARAELRQTVTKLRQAIEEIDREARAKLEDAFRKIDSSFSDLFVRLFSGGAAHLKLVGSEDILDAGLEIYASPPGKRLQVLSLLSGGEQALTAMALIFAAFLSNPAPICVLDEVDAPLDDANADRLCRLVETMAADDATRFLVVTHNPLTMARMNRLYGVTMQEQGVSMVTKVDLDKAIAIIDS
jgi:chromosome segregation protein